MKKIIIIILVIFILSNINAVTVALLNNDVEFKFEKELQLYNYFDYFLDQKMDDIEKAFAEEITADIYASQSFTPRNSELARIDLFLYKDDESGGNITVSIRKERDSEDIAIVSKSSNDIPKRYDMGWVSFDFPSVNLTICENYFIICKTNSNDGVFYWLTSKANPYRFGEAYEIIEDFLWDEQIFYDCTFRTYGLKPMNNNAPSTPIFNGTKSGSTDKKYQYSFVSEDDNGDDIYYYIDWDEININNKDYYSHSWIGPNSSGKMQKYFYNWSEKGWHKIRIKAVDEHGFESKYSSINVIMPVYKKFDFIFNFKKAIFNIFNFL